MRNEPITVDNAPGVKLTDRDRDLLGLFVLARYLTSDQVHRLAFPGTNRSACRRRLLRLSLGKSPFLRQRSFRLYNGERAYVWAPTPHGLSVALARAEHLPELPKHDVGANFLEHLIQMNELLVALWSQPGRCPRAAQPALRWTPSDRVRLMWGEWEIREGRKQQRVIQPDAVLEVLPARKRFFLECEMGSHPIYPGEGNAAGATLNKAERYRMFLTELSGDGRRTHYAVQYGEKHGGGFAPEVLFLVRTPGRAASVNAALAKWRAEVNARCSIRALTFDDAADELRKLAGLPRGAEGAASRPTATAAPQTLAPAEVELLRRCLYDSAKSIKRARAVFRELKRTDLPPYPDSYETAWRMLDRLTQ